MESSFLEKLFTPLCLCSLGVVLLAVWLDRDREWLPYQKAYYRAAASLTDEPLKQKQILASPLEIRQIQTAVDGRADRCITCHLGVDNPNFTEAEQPYTTHPKQESFRKMLHHSLDEFGCTFCHDGQGLATTREAAHGTVPHWDRPLLTGEWLDVGCGRCHKGTLDLAGAPILSQGRRLVKKVGCHHCHTLEGFEQEKPEAFGPSLLGAGLKLNEAWLKGWLKDPFASTAKTKMLNFYLTEEEAQALTRFVMTRKGGDAVPADSLADVPEAARGRELFEALRCFFCHKLEGFQKKDMAPDLTGFGIKNALDLDFGAVKDAEYSLRGWTQRKLKEPRAFQTQETKLTMPGNDLREDEVISLAVLLLGCTGEGVSKAYLRREEFGENEGKRLFDELHCVGCHNVRVLGLSGFDPENMAVDLSEVGSKVKVAWMFQWLTDPASLYPETRMPTVGALTEEQALKLTETVMGFHLHDGNGLPGPEGESAATTLEAGRIFAAGALSADATAAGRKVFEFMQCYRCHRIAGRGGRIAPELSRIGEKVRSDWLLTWLSKPENYNLNMLDDRTVELSAKQVADLAAYLLSLRQGALMPPELPEGALLIHAEAETAPTDWERGRRLFGEAGPVQVLFGKRVGKMGLGCYGCHRLEGRGGDIGPDLSEAGYKLSRDWLLQWLQDPLRLLPDSRMGNFHLTAAEAAALTNYLMTQKARETESLAGRGAQRSRPRG